MSESEVQVAEVEVVGEEVKKTVKKTVSYLVIGRSKLGSFCFYLNLMLFSEIWPSSKHENVHDSELPGYCFITM